MQLIELHQSEEENHATGGHFASMSRRVNPEASYQRKAEHLTTDENLFKVLANQVLQNNHSLALYFDAGTKTMK